MQPRTGAKSEYPSPKRRRNVNKTFTQQDAKIVGKGRDIDWGKRTLTCTSRERGP